MDEVFVSRCNDNDKHINLSFSLMSFKQIYEDGNDNPIYTYLKIYLHVAPEKTPLLHAEVDSQNPFEC